MRLFAAIEAGTALREELRERIGRARSQLPSASWVRPEAMHLTLAFLGDHPGENLPVIGAAIETAVGSHAPFVLRASSPGFFPMRGAPRVGWLAVEPAAPACSLADSVRSELTRSRIAFDSKRFVPHLTLCRMRGRWTAADQSRFAQVFETIRDCEFEVREVILFRSELAAKGAIHHPELRASLT